MPAARHVIAAGAMVLVFLVVAAGIGSLAGMLLVYLAAVPGLMVIGGGIAMLIGAAKALRKAFEEG